VAIKEIKKDASFGLEDVLTEIDMMRRCGTRTSLSAHNLSHPNVIAFYGGHIMDGGVIQTPLSVFH
jgi:hypothetical protein